MALVLLSNSYGATAKATCGGTFDTSSNMTQPASGSIFGLNAATGTAAGNTGSSTANPSFSGSTPAGNIFGVPKSADQTASTTQRPTTSNIFGQPSSSSASATAAPSSGGLFNPPPKPADTSSGATSTTAASSGGLFGGGMFGAKTSVPTASFSSTAPAPFLPFFNLGGTKDASAPKDAPKDAPTPKDTTSSAAPSFFANKPEEKKDSTAPTLPTFNLFPPKDNKDKDGGTAAGEKKDSISAPLPTFSLGSSTAPKDADKSAPSTSTAAAPSSSIAVPPPSMLRGKTIEEIVNKWSTELEAHVREFNKFAGEVAVWDRALIENGNNLAALYAHVLAAEQEQNDIDQSLDHIEQQQKDLAATLEAYEKSTDEILGGQGSNLRALDTGPADTERDKNYMLATELHGHLDDLSGSLTQMIDAVNALSLPSVGSANGMPQDGGEDAMSQIAQILNSHLESLMWIDGAVREVEGKITDVEKRVRGAGESTTGSGSKTRGLIFGASR
ncbi:hypothetical protein AcW1_004649 [Taiwanofungus camphoratus]|nr:hypothetical protein AcW1_004649 [Antrodia cinnamomea]